MTKFDKILRTFDYTQKRQRKIKGNLNDFLNRIFTQKRQAIEEVDF